MARSTILSECAEFHLRRARKATGDVPRKAAKPISETPATDEWFAKHFPKSAARARWIAESKRRRILPQQR